MKAFSIGLTGCLLVLTLLVPKQTLHYGWIHSHESAIPESAQNSVSSQCFLDDVILHQNMGIVFAGFGLVLFAAAVSLGYRSLLSPLVLKKASLRPGRAPPMY